MEKSNVDRLVSIILERIKEDPINEQSAPGGFVFVGNRNDLMNYLRMTEEPQQREGEAEFNEMAQPREYPIEKIGEPLRIPVEQLVKSPRTPAIPPITSKDPVTNELVENVAIGDTIMTTPSGRRFLIFENFAGREEGGGKKTEYYVEIPENLFMMAKPRGQKYGKPIPKNVIQTLRQDRENETRDERDERLGELRRKEEGLAKRLLFPTINYMFTRQDVMDHLDKCLIPETWAMPRTTEHTTNVEIRKQFGGSSTDIDADFYAVRDFTDINETINNMLDLRAELALMEAGAERTTPRQESSPVPRRHANYIYRRGNWEARYRTHNEQIFEEEGAKTLIYRLNSKNIQEGAKTISNESVLHIRGELTDDNRYVMMASFSTTINARNRENGVGENRGQLYEPIVVTAEKVVPNDIPPEELNMVDHPEFWVNEGRTRGSLGETTTRTGFLPDLINELGDAIIAGIDVDDIQQKIAQLAEDFVDEPQDNNF